MVRISSIEHMYILMRINREHCQTTSKALTDDSLMPKFLESKALQKSIKSKHESLIELGIVVEEQRNVIIALFFDSLIHPGLKGNVRGKEFNNIVKNRIISMCLDNQRLHCDA
jgi:hypothetical protein